jgi:multiple sugar transport system substrate-binding protein
MKIPLPARLLAVPTLLLASAALAQTPAFPAYSGPPVTLTFWSWVPGIDKTVAAFEKVYPKIHIKWSNVGSGSAEYTKLLTALKAGTGAPDVAQVEYDFLPDFINYGGLVNLTKYGMSKYKSLFVPWTWGQVSPQGSAVYAIPQDTGPFALNYRADIFKKYGLAVPKTWAQFAADAAKLKRESGGKIYFSDFFSTYAPWVMGLAWADGGRFWTHSGHTWTQSLNNAAAKRVMSFWGKLVKAGEVATLPDFTSELNSALAKGQVALLVQAAWGPGSLASTLGSVSAGDWRAAPLPQWTAGGHFASGNWGGSSDVVTIQSKHKQAAAIFALWINAAPTAVALNWQNGGLFPADRAGLSLPALHDPHQNPSKFFGGQNIAQIYAQASRGVPVNFVWAPWFLYANNSFNRYAAAAVSGKMGWAASLDAWQNDVLSYAKGQGYQVKGN